MKSHAAQSSSGGERITGCLDGPSRNAVADFLTESGWLEEHDDAVAARFKDEVIDQYRALLDKSVGIRQSYDDRIQREAIMNLVDLTVPHKSQKSRWLNGDRIGWDYLFLGVAAMDIDLGPKWPHPHTLKRNAIMATMQFIRHQLLRMGTTRDFTVVDFEITSAASQNITWQLAVQPGGQGLYGRASRELSTITSKYVGWDVRLGAEEICSTLAIWFKPWVLFHAAIPFTWNY